MRVLQFSAGILVFAWRMMSFILASLERSRRVHLKACARTAQAPVETHKAS